MALTLSSAPSEEPITKAEVKLHARITGTDEDANLDAYIKTARLFCEAFTKRQFVTATWVLRCDGFPAVDTTPIIVPRPPLSSVSSITYLDTTGTSQTWSSSKYQVDTYTEPGRIMPVEGETYPSTQADTFNTVTVTFVAGYGAASTVPERYKQAIRMLASHLYENREATTPVKIEEVPMAVKYLLHQDRMWMF